MAHEQRFNSSIARVQRRKSAEDQRRGREGRCVHVEPKQSIDRSESGWGAGHAVIGRGKTIHVFVPGGSAWEQELYRDTGKIHVPKRFRKSRNCTWRSEDEHYRRTDEWRSKMCDAIREPGQHIQDDVLMRGEDVAQVGSVEDVLQCWQDAYPNWRAVFAGHKSKSVLSAPNFELRSLSLCAECGCERMQAVSKLTGKHKMRLARWLSEEMAGKTGELLV